MKIIQTLYNNTVGKFYLAHPNRIPFPKSITIETTNLCNLRCKFCPTNRNPLRKKGRMPFDKFKSIIDEMSDTPLKHVNLDLGGEPLLDKGILNKIKYCSKRGINTFMSTNAVFLDKFKEGIFDSGLTEINLDLDGTTKETYEYYRINSDFGKVLENITNFCRYKQIHKFTHPKITLLFLVTRKNEHQISDILKLAKQLKVDTLLLDFLYLGWAELYLNYNKSELLKELPTNYCYSRYDMDGNIRNPPLILNCIFGTTAVLWNGDVTTCCYDINGENVVGNIFKDDGGKKIFRSDKYNEMRKK